MTLLFVHVPVSASGRRRSPALVYHFIAGIYFRRSPEPKPLHRPSKQKTRQARVAFQERRSRSAFEHNAPGSPMPTQGLAFAPRPISRSDPGSELNCCFWQIHPSQSRWQLCFILSLLISSFFLFFFLFPEHVDTRDAYGHHTFPIAFYISRTEYWDGNEG